KRKWIIFLSTSSSVLFNLAFLVSSPSPSQLYEKCRDAVFKYGDISIGYPFSGGDRDPECGHPNLELRCDDFTNTAKIEIVGIKYMVLDIHHESWILRIAREDFINNGSFRPQIPIQNSVLNSKPFVLGSGNTNLCFMIANLHRVLEYSLAILQITTMFL
ncbi:LEAF RUST 10 DISEASE-RESISTANCEUS RECEPTOR-LIKE PROTEIN KINASE-like 2.3, partial [Gossypium hirsutum]|uniref:LEAF RUST 10 DISEASE-RESISTANCEUS RECEPTOR-LIKE PROTEIN KINASE-like 2.3 n=1 Tax=Gossypium hirsutum TaxID=3635 RepID=A0ABM2Z5I9_GOSHI